MLTNAFESIPNWTEVLNKISNEIKKIEITMRAKALSLPVEVDGLSWQNHGKYMRICLENKPLIEHKAETRAQYFDKIPALIKAANEEMIKKYGVKNLNGKSC